MSRVLLIPQVGLSDLLGDSSFQFMYANVEAAHRMGRKHFFYIVVPHWSYGEIPPLPNLHVTRVEMNRDFFYNDLLGVPPHVLGEMFGRRGGRFIVDAIHSEMVRSAWYMGQVIADYRAKTLPVFITDPVSIDDWLTQSWEQEVANICSSMACYRMVGSKWLKESYLDAARKYMKPSMVDKYSERLELVSGNGIKFEEYFRIRDEEANNKHEKVSLFCGSRFTPDKGITFIQDVFRKLYAGGRDIYVMSTTNTAENKGSQLVGKDLSHLKMLKYSCSRDEYMHEAARCHVSLSAAGEETFAMHIIEHLALGLVCVVPNKDWVWRWIPKDYPFVYESRSLEQAYGVVSWVMDNLEKAKEMIRPICEKIFAEYDSKLAMERYLEVIERRIAGVRRDHKASRPRFVQKGKFRIPFRVELIDVAMTLGESFTFKQLLDALKGRMTGMNVRVLMQPGGPRLGVPTLYDIRATLHSYGFEDACDHEDVRFVRTSEAKSIAELYGDLIDRARALDAEADPEKRRKILEEFDAEDGEEADEIGEVSPE